MTAPIQIRTNDINNVHDRGIQIEAEATIGIEKIAEILIRATADTQEQGINAANRTARQSDSTGIRSYRKANKSTILSVIFGAMIAIIAASAGAWITTIIHGQAINTAIETIDIIGSETISSEMIGAIKTSYVLPSRTTVPQVTTQSTFESTGFDLVAATTQACDGRSVPSGEGTARRGYLARRY